MSKHTFHGFTGDNNKEVAFNILSVDSVGLRVIETGIIHLEV